MELIHKSIRLNEGDVITYKNLHPLVIKPKHIVMRVVSVVKGKDRYIVSGFKLNNRKLYGCVHIKFRYRQAFPVYRLSEGEAALYML